MSVLNQFNIGFQDMDNGGCESLCDVKVTASITQQQLQEMIDMLNFYVLAILPHRVQVDDLLDHLRSIFGGNARITKDATLEYYGNDELCRGSKRVKIIITIFYNNQRHYYEYDNDIDNLATFLKTIVVI